MVASIPNFGTQLSKQVLMSQDESNRLYRKLIDFRGTANDLSMCVLDRIKVSKVRNATMFCLFLSF